MSENVTQPELSPRDQLYARKMGSIAILELPPDVAARRIQTAGMWADRRVAFEDRSAELLARLTDLLHNPRDISLNLLRVVAARVLIEPEGVGLSELYAFRSPGQNTIGDAVRKLHDERVIAQITEKGKRDPSFQPTQLYMMTVVDRQEELGFLIRGAKAIKEDFAVTDLLPYITEPDTLDTTTLPLPE